MYSTNILKCNYYVLSQHVGMQMIFYPIVYHYVTLSYSQEKHHINIKYLSLFKNMVRPG